MTPTECAFEGCAAAPETIECEDRFCSQHFGIVTFAEIDRRMEEARD